MDIYQRISRHSATWSSVRGPYNGHQNSHSRFPRPSLSRWNIWGKSAWFSCGFDGWYYMLVCSISCCYLLVFLQKQILVIGPVLYIWYDALGKSLLYILEHRQQGNLFLASFSQSLTKHAQLNHQDEPYQ